MISLWTRFSVISIYAFVKRIINRRLNKIEEIEANVSAVINRKVASINKNDNQKSTAKIVLKYQLNHI